MIWRGLPEHTVDFLISDSMRQQFGYLLQLAALTFLPLLILWQLEFGFRLIMMPALTLVGVLVFWLGHRLREG